MYKKQIIDKTTTLVEENFIWLAANDNEMPAELDSIDIEGVLRLDEWDSSIVSFIKINNIEGIELKGDRFNTTSFSLLFLEDLTELKYLKISGKFKKNEYKTIEKLFRLEQLIISDYEAYELNFSKFTKLKSYFSPIKHNDHPIFNCHNIEYLRTNTNLEIFQPFSKLINIKKLYMMAKKLKDLNGIEKLRNLQSLEIDYGRNLKDMSSISCLNKLENLSLYGCKKIHSLDEISKISNLRCLSFDGCGTIISLKPLLKSKFLLYISFGDTVIDDGDLECLTQIKTLRGIYFKNKNSYNKKIEDFKQYNFIC